ncbi:MAG TPA: ATP-binding cassette domain-containing protein [Negativicutes bacterium]|nr:ATP-binding cassette domain-containing protein [Negativicutes bacterium]
MDNLLEVKDLKVTFDIKRGFIESLTGRNKATVKAVDGVSFSIGRGEILSLVGESGSGKTTTGRAILNLVRKNGGEVLFDSSPVDRKDRIWEQQFRKRVQMIFQDPYQP